MKENKANKKGRKLLLKFTEFISGGIGFISGINKSFPQITLQIQYILQRDHVRAAIFLRRDLHRTIAQRGQGLMQRRADPLVELRL